MPTYRVAIDLPPASRGIRAFMEAARRYGLYTTCRSVTDGPTEIDLTGTTQMAFTFLSREWREGIRHGDLNAHKVAKAHNRE